jgi:hypothetical protein
VEVRQLLGKLSSDLVIEFDEAEKNYQEVNNNWQSSVTAAATMRNVLTHYIGKLWARVKQPSEQKRKWRAMVERISINPVGSPGFQNLLDQERTWGQLHQGLSDLTHGKSTPGSDLVTLHTRMLDHIYSVLSLAQL